MGDFDSVRICEGKSYCILLYNDTCSLEIIFFLVKQLGICFYCTFVQFGLNITIGRLKNDLGIFNLVTRYISVYFCGK